MNRRRFQTGSAQGPASAGLRSARAQFGRLDDQELILCCLSGEAHAWDALIDRYASLIYTVCLRSGLPEADAQDVFQDVSLLLVQHLASLRDHTRLSAWLISTTRREAWRCAKRKRTVLSSELPLGMENLERQAEGPSPEVDCLALEDRVLVRQGLALLPDRCRELLALLYFHDPPRSYAEIADCLDMPLGSIGPARARCLNKLLKIIRDLGY